jgi:hypothetical protein
MPTQSASMPSIALHSPAFDEDAVYEVVANEMESGKTDKGLWTRLFAELDGDEKRTKIAYIKQRAEKLMAAERHRVAELERQHAIEMANVERLSQQRDEAISRLALDEVKVMKIHKLAEQHMSNPRLTTDEKEQLLRLAGGGFAWVVDGYGKCTATFLSEERHFSSVKDFATWFSSEVIPTLLAIKKV